MWRSLFKIKKKENCTRDFFFLLNKLFVRPCTDLVNSFWNIIWIKATHFYEIKY